jgi:hypothetical protein
VEDLIARVASNIEAYSQDQQQIQERLIYLDKLLAHTGHTRQTAYQEAHGREVGRQVRRAAQAAALPVATGAWTRAPKEEQVTLARLMQARIRDTTRLLKRLSLHLTLGQDQQSLSSQQPIRI